jgi:hypothetical protein
VVVGLLVFALALVALLAVFVVALLRSHAEIIRRLTAIERGGATGQDSGSWAGAQSPSGIEGEQRAPGIVGRTLTGDTVKVDLAAGSPTTLLAFLSSGCAACEPLWGSLREGASVPAGARLVIVVQDLAQESPSRIADLAPAGHELLMSTQAWREYAVPASPHFVLVDGGSGTIAGRGAAGSWAQISAMVEQALADAAYVGSNPQGGDLRELRRDPLRARSTNQRAERAEQALAAAGIGPGHPSLYPAGGQPLDLDALTGEAAEADLR